MNEMLGIIQNVAQKEANSLLSTELGVVKTVFPHADESDKNNYQCSIELKNRRTADGKPLELTKVPVAVPYIGMTCIPNVGDLVLVNFVGGDINAPVIIGRLYNDEDRPPENKENEFQIKHTLKEGGTLKIDAEGAITITSKNEENILTLDNEKFSITNEKLSLEIDFSGEKITIESSKDMELKADGNLKLSGKEVSIASQAAMKVESGSSLDIKSSAAMKVKGATIDLN